MCWKEIHWLEFVESARVGCKTVSLLNGLLRRHEMMWRQKTLSRARYPQLETVSRIKQHLGNFAPCNRTKLISSLTYYDRCNTVEWGGWGGWGGRGGRGWRESEQRARRQSQYKLLFNTNVFLSFGTYLIHAAKKELHRHRSALPPNTLIPLYNDINFFSLSLSLSSIAKFYFCCCCSSAEKEKEINNRKLR